MRVLEIHPPSWRGQCPLCRQPVSLYSLVDATGTALSSPDITSLYGGVFVQMGTLGLASYHFESEDNCYISYASAPPNWKLEDGTPVPEKKLWVDTSFDLATFTFRGRIDWDPAFGGSSRWDYTIVFAENFSGVIGGRVATTELDGSQSNIEFANPWDNVERYRSLAYFRWTPPPSTPFGSVFVQGFLYAPLLEGIASYHFDSVDPGSCYISYASAPPTWLLDDGSPPPNKKAFENVSYDERSRTFQGTIVWDPRMFGGSLRWEYHLVFAEDFSAIISGTNKKYGPDDVEQGTSVFRDPAEGMRTPNSLIYVRKPAAAM